MKKSNQLLEEALNHQKKGSFPSASLIYQTVLKSEPKNARALFLYGTLLCQTGKFEESVSFLKSVIELKEELVDAYNALGNAYQGLGLFEDAKEAYLRAIEKNSPHACNNYGVMLFKQNKTEQAMSFFQGALSLQPTFVEALVHLGECHDKKGQYDMAIRIYQQALKHNPQLSLLWLHLGNSQKNSGLFNEAELSYRNAIKLNPADVMAINNLGIVFKDQGKLDESMACYDEILKRGVKTADVLFNRGLTLKEMGLHQEALQCYDEALLMDPQNVQGHVNRCNIRLILGEYEKVWDDYEWRLKTPSYGYLQNYVQPKWNGESLEGKRIVVVGEQGLGDELLYGTCINEIIPKAQKVYFECTPKLLPLFKRSFPAAEVSARQLDGSKTPLMENQDIDFSTPLMSLMRFFRRTKEDFGRNPFYLRADQNQVAKWKDRLNKLGPKPKIGFAWKTMSADKNNSLRNKSSTSIDLWKPFLSDQKFDFINLQYGQTQEETDFVKNQWGVTLHQWTDLDLTNDLDGVASLVSCLDRVVSIDSTIIMLAGHLNVPVWVAAHFAYGKNVGQDFDHAYLPFKYFVQHVPGDWTGVIDRLCQAQNESKK